MKRIFIVLLAGFFALNSFSQENDSNEFRIKPFFSIGVGFGYINPKDINNYLNDYWDDINSDYLFVLTTGFPEMYLSLNGHLGVGAYTNEKTELEGFFEYSIAPKDIDGRLFKLTRSSPGASVSYHFYKKGDIDLSIGGALLYHNMKFESFEARSLGARFKFGFNRKVEFARIEAFLCLDIAKGETDAESYSPVESLSFSGITLGSYVKF